MRHWLLTSVCFLLFTAPQALAESAPRTMSVVEWLNYEARMSPLVLLGQVSADASANAQTGILKLPLTLGKIYMGPSQPQATTVTLHSAFEGGRYQVPAPFKKDQWALLFLRSQHHAWVSPPSGYVVETPYAGLSFYPAPGFTLTDAAKGLSWDYVLGALKQILDTRHQIIDGNMPSLRAARTKEQHDRVMMSIEGQIKQQLGLPEP
jgi:hypothetical protein